MALSGADARTSCPSCSRPRDRRDITVPIGTPTTVLISWYDISSISRRISTSRNSRGSAAMHACRWRASPARSAIVSGDPKGPAAPRIAMPCVSSSKHSSMPRRFCAPIQSRHALRTMATNQAFGEAPCRAVEEPIRAQARLLDDVFGGAGVAHEPARQAVRGVEMDEHRRLEAMLARRLSHGRCIPGLRGECDMHMTPRRPAADFYSRTRLGIGITEANRSLCTESRRIDSIRGSCHGFRSTRSSGLPSPGRPRRPRHGLGAAGLRASRSAGRDRQGLLLRAALGRALGLRQRQGQPRAAAGLAARDRRGQRARAATRFRRLHRRPHADDRRSARAEPACAR